MKKSDDFFFFAFLRTAGLICARFPVWCFMILRFVSPSVRCTREEASQRAALIGGDPPRQIHDTHNRSFFQVSRPLASRIPIRSSCTGIHIFAI